MSSRGPAAHLPQGAGPSSHPWHVQILRRICSPTFRRGPQGKGAQGPLSSVAPCTGPAPQRLLCRPSGGPNPRQGPAPAAGPKLGSSGPPPPRAQSPTRLTSGRQRPAPLLRSLARVRCPAAGAPPCWARKTVPGLDSPRAWPRLGSPSRGATSSRPDSAPLPPPGPTLPGAPPGVGFLQIFSASGPAAPTDPQGVS
ncbi:hypothetical protein NDU88_003228 [Pleurodeles waltl]|uniref:Basic proline-rich protein-like n=1 Tax=Pleurodeles waltl TaxID=8319 RepID=A0AAV7RFN8_PLEWA|nr:hypothetical protein NDU88_003228 [Pleurodeles waltl]